MLEALTDREPSLRPGAESVLARVFWRPVRPAPIRTAEVWHLPLPRLPSL